MSAGNWWSKRWEALLADFGIGKPDSAASRAYRVKRLEVVPGGISASVQDRDAGACAIEIGFVTLRDEQWERVYELLGNQALVNTQILSGAMPPEIEQLFIDAGARLMPASQADFAVRCSCCPPKSCRHLPLIFSLFAEMLNDDPGLLLTLRGRDRQQILREVRETRGAQPAAAEASAAAPAPGTPAQPEPDPASQLTAQLDQYWGNRKLLKQFHHHIAPPTVELSLLRRLGPLNTSDDAMALYEQMVALYRRISEEALALAYASDENENGETRGS